MSVLRVNQWRAAALNGGPFGSERPQLQTL